MGKENLFIIVPAKVLELTVIESAWVFSPFLNQSLWPEGRDRMEWNTLLGQVGLCGSSPLNLRWGQGTLTYSDHQGVLTRRVGMDMGQVNTADVDHT